RSGRHQRASAELGTSRTRTSRQESHHMVRVAVLGAGFMGGVHSKAYTTLPDAEIAVIYSPSPDRGQPLAEELGVRWSDDLDAILADPEVEAVDICLPTPQHRPVT